MRCVDRYILSSFIKPMAVVVGISLALLMLENLWRLFDLVLQEGQPVWIVGLMLVSLLPEYLGLAIPMGVLLGVTLMIRKFSINHELGCFFSCGIGPLQILRVPIVVAILSAALTLLMTGFITPRAEYFLQKIIFQVQSGQFGIKVKSGEYFHISKGVVMRVEGMDDETHQPKSVFLNLHQKDGSNSTLTADSGQILMDSDHKSVILKLKDGVLIRTSPGRRAPTVITFKFYDLPVRLPGIPIFRGRGAQDQELTLGELLVTAKSRTVDNISRQDAAAKFHRRLVLAATALWLPLLGFAMGVCPPRSNTVAGIVSGMTFYIVYLKLIDFFAATALGIAPVLLWLLLSGLFVLAVWLFRKAAAGSYLLVTMAGQLIALWQVVLLYVLQSGAGGYRFASRNKTGVE